MTVLVSISHFLVTNLCKRSPFFTTSNRQLLFPPVCREEAAVHGYVLGDHSSIPSYAGKVSTDSRHWSVAVGYLCSVLGLGLLAGRYWGSLKLDMLCLWLRTAVNTASLSVSDHLQMFTNYIQHLQDDYNMCTACSQHVYVVCIAHVLMRTTTS